MFWPQDSPEVSLLPETRQTRQMALKPLIPNAELMSGWVHFPTHNPTHRLKNPTPLARSVIGVSSAVDSPAGQEGDAVKVEYGLVRPSQAASDGKGVTDFVD